MAAQTPPLARALWLATLLPWACTERVEVPYVEGTRSAVLVMESGTTVRMLAHDLVGGSEGLAAALDDSSQRLTVLTYARTLAELQLVAGELTRETDPLLSRPLPRADHVRTTPAPFDAWEAVPAPGEAVLAFTIARESAEACAGRGGCLVGDLAERICQPCAERAPFPVPALPERPVLTPCPSGWPELEVRNDGALEDVTPRSAVVCQPEPAGPLTCAPGTRALPGAQACAAIGPPCPGGGEAWPADVPEPASFVDAAAIGPGTGTRRDPWRSLDDALAAWAPGQTIALARGSYAPTRALPAGVRVVGACATETSLALTGPVSDASLAQVGLSGDVDATGALDLAAVDLRGSIRSSVALDALDLAVSGTVTLAGGRAALVGGDVDGALLLGPSTTASVSRSRLARVGAERAHLAVATSIAGPLALDASTVDVTTSALHGAIDVRGGVLTVERTWLRGAIAALDGAQVTARDLVLDVMPARDGVTAHASRVELTRAFIEGAAGAGIFTDDVGGRGTQLVLRDVMILSTRNRDVGDGQGIRTRAGTIDVSHTLIEDTLGPGITTDGTRGDVTLEDLTIADCGDGLRLNGERSITVARAVLDGIRGQGIITGDSDASQPVVDISDTTVTGTRRPFCNGNDCPIAALTVVGGSVRARRLILTRSEDVALRIVGTDLVLSDATIAENPVAIQLERAGFDLDHVLDGVRYSGNRLLVRRLVP